MSLNAIDVASTISSEQGALYVVLNIKNVTADAVLLETLPADRERTLGPEFLLKSGGREVPFIGAMAKRRPYEKADFTELKAGATCTRKIRVDLDYELLQGKHRYDITYMYLIYNELNHKVEAGYSEATNFEYSR